MSSGAPDVRGTCGFSRRSMLAKAPFHFLFTKIGFANAAVWSAAALVVQLASRRRQHYRSLGARWLIIRGLLWRGRGSGGLGRGGRLTCDVLAR